MRVYILGSNAFMHKMVATTDELIAMGVNAHIAPHYRKLVAGGMKEQEEMWEKGEKAKVKIMHDYFKMHYKHILESDAILIVNDTKKDIPNYIGGNVLMEMGQAYVNDKKIYLLNGMPTNKSITYLDEIIALQPVCLNGDLTKLIGK